MLIKWLPTLIGIIFKETLVLKDLFLFSINQAIQKINAGVLRLIEIRRNLEK